jgi:Pyruvate/2-oxoacid:ferredoxin oxidoreductase gamma subunit
MSTLVETPQSKTKKEVIERAVIRFAGDSGDGMQITGTQFTNTVALYGNDIATFPDYPAEIRAPAGTIPGVSGFQLHFGSGDVYTPGDTVDALIAMNPAALKVNLAELKPNGILIVNCDSFKESDLRKAHFESNPLEDHSLDSYRVFPVELERLTRLALEHLGMRWACATGSTTGRWKRRFAGSRRNSRRSRSWWKPTNWHSRAGMPTARPRKLSRSATKSRRPSSRRGCTAASAATRRWRWDLSLRRRRPG